VEQRFANPFDDPIEVTYTFPLPGECAVRDCELRVGPRVVRANLFERAEARNIYRRALERGHRASLLEQERDNVFTIQVGNVLPGDDIVIRLEYCERLPLLADGRAELRLPLVVAPRYMHGEVLDGEQTGTGVEPDSDLIPDASRLSPPRLAPGFDPGTALSIEVDVMGRVSELASTQHAIQSSVHDGHVRVSLATERARLDRDFVLRWMVRGEAVAAQLVRHDDFAMITLVAPPAGDSAVSRPRDVVFVLDRSGSMSGEKLASASLACELLLRSLSPRDCFRLMAFDDRLQWMSRDGIVANEHGFARAQQWLAEIDARGGTEINHALESALDAFGDDDAPDAHERIVILLTDGQVGDEAGALRIVQENTAQARLFTIGIDTAVNDGLLRRLAKLGRGSAFFVEPRGKIEEAMRSIARQIGTPTVTELALSGVYDRAPARIPDLFAGQSVVVFARAESDVVEVSGRRHDGTPFRASLTPEATELRAVEQLWARHRIAELENALRIAPDRNLREEIIELSVRHRVLSRLTAFVAVDESTVAVTDGASPRAVVQPVELPALWESADLAAAAPAMPVHRSAVMSYMLAEQPPVTSISFPLESSVSGSFDAPSSAPPERLRRQRRGAKNTRGGWEKLLTALEALRTLVLNVGRSLEAGARADGKRLLKALKAVERAITAAQVDGALVAFVLRAGEELVRALEGGGEVLDVLERVRSLHVEVVLLSDELRRRYDAETAFWVRTL
jgi:Ca-activated chloride channel family protein